MPDLTSRAVEERVAAARLTDLVAALIEPDAEGCIPAVDATAFPCVHCQREPRRWMLTGPAAEPIGRFRWECCLCRRGGTLFSLRTMVLSDPDSLVRFLDAADGEAA